MEKRNIIEFRYPNGTLNHIIIKNNINFCLKLIDSILAHRHDEGKLDEMIKEDLQSKEYFLDGITLTHNYSRFESLVRNIATREEDINSMMGQYERVLKTRKWS